MSGHIRHRVAGAVSVCAQSLTGRVRSLVWISPEEDGPVIASLHYGQVVRSESGSGSIQLSMSTGSGMKPLLARHGR